MKRYKLATAAILIIFVLSILGMTGCTAVYFLVKDQFYRERCSHLEDTIKQMTNHVEYVLDKQWKLLDAAEFYLEKNTETDKTMSGDFIINLSDIISEDSVRILLVGDKGNVYGQDANYKQGDFNDLVSFEGDEWMTIRSMPSEDGGKDAYIMLIRRIGDIAVVAPTNENITHIVLIQKVEYLRDDFRLAEYQKKNRTMLLDGRGACIYYDIGETDDEIPYSLFERENIIDDMNKAPFLHYGDYDKFRKDIENKKEGSTEIVPDGVSYFLYYSPIGLDWTMLTFVPGRYVANNVGLSNSLSTVVTVFCAILLILAIVSFLLLISMRSRSAQLYKERIASEQLKEAVEEANRANRAKSDFLSRMSHDIRTPLSGIIGMLDIIEKHGDDKRRTEDCMKKIRGSANHLLSLINDVLDMNKADNEQTELQHDPFNINELLNSCLTIIEGQMLNRVLMLSTDFKELNHPYLYGSPLHIRQILLNILSNSVKFTKDGGEICLSVRETEYTGEKAVICFTVSDNGIGMSEDFQKHVFEAFTQEDYGSRTDYMGTGLGMAITKSLTQRMGGTISVQSKLNEGTTFTVSIPFDVDNSRDCGENSNNSITFSGIRGLHFLLAEDNEINREIAQILLEDEGAVVTAAENGQRAVDIFKESSPGTFDVILMDLMMPLLNGFEATEEIRAMEREDARTILIIAMTANAYEQDVEKSIAAGMNAHLTKPLDLENLCRIIASFR